jgi:hypothetical protein
VNRNEYNTVIKQNIEKSYNLIGEECDYSVTADGGTVLQKQLNELSVNNRVVVLCTCAFYIAENHITLC